MNSGHECYRYLDDSLSFQSVKAAAMRQIYVPLCGKDAASLKSSITPFLSGDIKRDKETYVTKPVSREDLRSPLRNFFVLTGEGDIFSLLDRETDEAAHVEIGQLWHKLVNRSQRLGLEYEVLNFIPVSTGDVELMQVRVKNCSDRTIEIVPTGCVPIFGRAMANKQDHEHVTALLHRTRQIPEGVLVSPTMVFNERGHLQTETQFFCFGVEADGALPAGSFPTVESFLGDGGIWEWPTAVVENHDPAVLSSSELNGREVAGALRFAKTVLKSGQVNEYVLMVGLANSDKQAQEIFNAFNSGAKVEKAFQETSAFWSRKAGSITVRTADPSFDSWMRWVCVQPVLRRIFGCSFLPDHDYGKGGKGWRDLWQDLLSLILIEPDAVRDSLIQNFGGVRLDGTNATIIGTAPGEFIADRNSITRVWMDHGAWPVLTVLLYIEQTGDFNILFEEVGYFHDAQLSRSFKRDTGLTSDASTQQVTAKGKVYRGSVLEHMLIQTLTQFFNVGEHNMIRLESADWNDGLDMGFERGESVAFSSFYAGNMLLLAELLKILEAKKKTREIFMCQELRILLDSLSSERCDYDDPRAKQRLLFERYCPAVEPVLSGEKIRINISDLAADLTGKGQWLFNKIRSQERLDVRVGGETFRWFNGYYDNRGNRVEGLKDKAVRMTLTGQVFSIMSGLADERDIDQVIRSADAFLKDPVNGGHRLNTDFGPNDRLLGRAFSFAYGTKENGSVFSHMAVMYGYALYKRGFVRQGFEVLNALYRMATRFDVSKIYPNIPEYFDSTGQGMYSYLTGSASWYVLTMLTQAFGVFGQNGDLVIFPKLVREQFDGQGRAQIKSIFAGRELLVVYENPNQLDFSEYMIDRVFSGGREVPVERLMGGGVCLKRAVIQSGKATLTLTVSLVKNAV
ncbi:MAG TPA: cellobiose phosphorylase [Candidatus Bathyarchaeia archaeon]|nr:cellobiose phosphorylase [Candidatus Bathyarchaeia archaeon]